MAAGNRVGCAVLLAVSLWLMPWALPCAALAQRTPDAAQAGKDEVVALLHQWLREQPWMAGAWSENLGYSEKTWRHERWDYWQVVQWLPDGKGKVTVQRKHSATGKTELVSTDQFAYAIEDRRVQDLTPSIGAIQIVLNKQASVPQRDGSSKTFDTRLILRPDVEWAGLDTPGTDNDDRMTIALRPADVRSGKQEVQVPFPIAGLDRLERAMPASHEAKAKYDALCARARKDWLAGVVASDIYRKFCVGRYRRTQESSILTGTWRVDMAIDAAGGVQFEYGEAADSGAARFSGRGGRVEHTMQGRLSSAKWGSALRGSGAIDNGAYLTAATTVELEFLDATERYLLRVACHRGDQAMRSYLQFTLCEWDGNAWKEDREVSASDVPPVIEAHLIPRVSIETGGSHHGTLASGKEPTVLTQKSRYADDQRSASPDGW